MKRFYEWFFPQYIQLWPTNYVLAMWSAPDRKLGETDWQALRVTLRKNPYHARIVCVFKAGIVCLAAMVMLAGCATPGTTSNDPLSSQKQWVEGAAWVEAIADGVVLSACAMDKISKEKCALYAVARSELDADLIVVQGLIYGKAAPAEVQAAITRAMISYAKIEAAYKGKI